MPTISVIIPAYNVERYIGRCMDSIRRQTFADFEVLLIDDGSRDATPRVCDDFASADSRIRVFHKENGGLSDARNYGLDRMSGRYVTFVDGDDYVAGNYLEYLYGLLSESGAQIAMIDGQRLRESENPCEQGNGTREILNTEEAVARMLLRNGITHTSWGKLYESSLWSRIRFPVGQYYEDYATTYRVFAGAGTAAYSDVQLYYYIQHAGSIMHNAVSEKTLRILDVSDEASEFLCDRWPDRRDDILDLQMATYLKCLQHILNEGTQSWPDYQQRIMDFARQNAACVLHSRSAPRSDKVKVLALLINKGVFLRLYNHFDGDIQVNG